MLTLLAVSAGVIGYLFMICMTAAALIKIDPYGMTATDNFWPWFWGLVWPLGIPVMVLVGLFSEVLFPVACWIVDRMVDFVDWTTAERKAKLPKAKVNK